MSTGGKSCVFCEIAQGRDEKTTLLYDDGGLMAFKDIRPAAPHHYLVCPKEHIKDAKCLTHTHIPLVEALIQAGKELLEKQGGDVSQARMGFHWPPFHLVNHLHLHVISPESEIGFMARMIYRPKSLWFVSEKWLQERLQKMIPETEKTEGQVETSPAVTE